MLMPQPPTWMSLVAYRCAVVLTTFVQAFATLSYTPCPDGSLEPGWEKVAIYATHEGPTHAARQLDNGRWTSKLEPDDDIEHESQGLRGSLYGTVVQFLRRSVAQP